MSAHLRPAAARLRTIHVAVHRHRCEVGAARGADPVHARWRRVGATGARVCVGQDVVARVRSCRLRCAESDAVTQLRRCVVRRISQAQRDGQGRWTGSCCRRRLSRGCRRFPNKDSHLIEGHRGIAPRSGSLPRQWLALHALGNARHRNCLHIRGACAGDDGVVVATRASLAPHSKRSLRRAHKCWRRRGGDHLQRGKGGSRGVGSAKSGAGREPSHDVDHLACGGVSCGHEHCLRLQVLQLLAEHIAGSHGIIKRRGRGRGTTDGQVPSRE